MYSRLLLYLGMLLIGILIGNKNNFKEKTMSVIQKLQIVAIVILLFTMGVGIGADKKVFNALSTIGYKAVVISLFTIVASVLGVFICRKLLGINMKGEKEND